MGTRKRGQGGKGKGGRGGRRWEDDGVSPASTPRSASGNHEPLSHRLKKQTSVKNCKFFIAYPRVFNALLA